MGYLQKLNKPPPTQLRNAASHAVTSGDQRVTCMRILGLYADMLTKPDNYQGEESDIVVASLTRSNSIGEIGFMSSPERLNVLLSRARMALIMIGNAKTFITSRKGKESWAPLFNKLKASRQLYDGLPVKCEQHPHKLSLLRIKEDFDTECPDGGCAEPW